MKKKFFILPLMFCFVAVSGVYAQVGMLTNNPNKDAVLDLNRTDGTSAKGLLLPNVALVAIDDSAPMLDHVAGMHVWNTKTDGSGVNAVTPGEYFNNGSKWIRVSSSLDAWIQDGNNNGAIKAIGTNDAFDLPIETNGVERMRITSTGNLGVGTSSPTSKLEVNSGTVNSSGLKFTNLKASTPISAGATLGVDDAGNVVTVTGNAFVAASESSSLASGVYLMPGIANFNVCSVLLPQPGTYLVFYSVRAQFASITNSSSFGRAFLSTAQNIATTVPDSEILLCYINSPYSVGSGGSYSGFVVYTVATGSQRLYLGVQNDGRSGQDLLLESSGNGKTKLGFVKITP